MPMIAAFTEGFGDFKAKLDVKRNGSKVVGFNAEDNGFVPGAAGSLDEGSEQGFAESLSARFRGDADVGQFKLAS